MKFWTLNLEKPRSKVSISNNLEFSNYVRVQNAHNVIPILWITLEEDLILSFPTLNSEKERKTQPNMIK